MTPFQRSAGVTLGINVALFGAVAMGGLSVFLWPNRPEDWGFGVMSVFLGMGSLMCGIDALGCVWRLYARDKAIADYLKQGGRPKTAQMASFDSLKRGGIIDG